MSVNYTKYPVLDCGHSYRHYDEFLKNVNCQRCLFVWFNAHGELVQATEQAYQEDPRIIVQTRGKKFLHRFLQFLSTVANMKKLEQEIQEAKEVAPEGAVLWEKV